MKRDLTNKRFGFLTALRKSNSKTGHTYWTCVCDCGNLTDVRADCLLYGIISSCKCQRSRNHYKGFNQLAGGYWSRVKKQAKDRNLEFNITIEQAWSLFEKQDKKCALTNREISLTRNKLNQTASLDRIDSSKGYTLDNIQWVHKDVNKMKNNLPEDKLFFWAKKIYENSLR